MNLSLGTASLRYCGRQHSRDLLVQHLEIWVSIQARNGIMMSWWKVSVVLRIKLKWALRRWQPAESRDCEQNTTKRAMIHHSDILARIWGPWELRHTYHTIMSTSSYLLPPVTVPSESSSSSSDHFVCPSGGRYHLPSPPKVLNILTYSIHYTSMAYIPSDFYWIFCDEENVFIIFF